MKINKATFWRKLWSTNNCDARGVEGGGPSSSSYGTTGVGIVGHPLAFIFGKSFYDDPTEEEKAAAATKAAEDAAKAAKAAEEAKSKEGRFTQADLDRVAAKERREWQEKSKKAAEELESVKSRFTGTAEEKAKLEQQIEELKTASLTKEQQLQRQLDKEKKDKEEKEKQLAAERDIWKTQHNSLLVKQKITEASAANDAYNTGQIIDLLIPKSKVVEQKDGEGKPTGEFKVVIKFDDVDAKTKEPVTLELDPDAALKRMKELPDRYGNLFKSNLQGGVGGSKKTASGKLDPSKMTTEEYMAARKAEKAK